MTIRRNGNESIVFNGNTVGYQLSDFWEWGFSDLLNNTLRGAFCEFIVTAALGLDPLSCRTDWTPWDLTVPYQWQNGDTCRDGIHIEVKSCAYLQSWKQSKLSNIVFSIRPTLAWDEISGYDNIVQRQSDVYVFGLYTVTDRMNADPIILDGWRFYVLATSVLNNLCGSQKTISLRSLEALQPLTVDFAGLKDAVFQCLQNDRC